MSLKYKKASRQHSQSNTPFVVHHPFHLTSKRREQKKLFSYNQLSSNCGYILLFWTADIRKQSKVRNRQRCLSKLRVRERPPSRSLVSTENSQTAWLPYLNSTTTDLRVALKLQQNQQQGPGSETHSQHQVIWQLHSVTLLNVDLSLNPRRPRLCLSFTSFILLTQIAERFCSESSCGSNQL